MDGDAAETSIAPAQLTSKATANHRNSECGSVNCLRITTASDFSTGMMRSQKVLEFEQFEAEAVAGIRLCAGRHWSAAGIPAEVSA
jgi:hypothetical protein